MRLSWFHFHYPCYEFDRLNWINLIYCHLNMFFLKYYLEFYTNQIILLLIVWAVFELFQLIISYQVKPHMI